LTSIELAKQLRKWNGRSEARSASSYASDRLSRWLNVVVALVGVVIAAPAMLLIAVLIKLTSKGPILYRQQRIGLDRRNGASAPADDRRQTDAGGRPFTIYKFRTMRVNGHGEDAEVWATPDDPRVTRVGRILRLYRLDELPQLFNVLVGDMNVVGPRPEQPRLFRNLREEIVGYQHRQRVPPGITGRAQISQQYDESVDDVRRKLAFDLEYITRRSVTEDVRIMLKTVPVVVFKRGAW
jgi:lipopolysaccharide/colanic/teichoic acid biosynthesis glycosyltransferase